MSFQKRLTLIIKELGYSKNSFADKLGYKNNTLIYDYTREDDKMKEPGFDFFSRLVQAKTGINLEWLIAGEGDRMNKKHTAATNNGEAAVNEERNLIATLEKAVDILDRDNENLWKQNADLLSLVRDLRIGGKVAVPNKG